MWRFITGAFEKEHQIILFDYVGSGKSDLTRYNPERYADLNGYAQDILEVCDALRLREVIFVGHSVSGITGLLAALKKPDLFRCLIMVSPSPRYIDDPPNYRGGLKKSDVEELLETMERNYIGWANFLAPVVIQRPDRPDLTEELRESFCSTDPVIARRFAQATFFSDNRADLSKSAVPALILQCVEDAIAPMEVGRYMHEKMPRSELRILETTGHCPHMSAPEATIEAIQKYLEEEMPRVERMQR
jgi:sigma-B regulation protein RsbQ